MLGNAIIAIKSRSKVCTSFLLLISHKGWGQWRKFSFLSGGARTINFPSREKCFCLTYFAGRPDVYRVLKCANGIGISDFTTICIQQKLIAKNENMP